jgi:hypothetical protein
MSFAKEYKAAAVQKEGEARLFVGKNKLSEAAAALRDADTFWAWVEVEKQREEVEKMK